ncbi:MAG: anti-sigma factor family protein [Planctomycetota bacterium]|jgi:hypothetical protein
MDCDEIKDMLDAYAAGELEDSENAAVREHIGKCHMCAAEVENFKVALAALREAGEETPEADRNFHRALGRRLDDVDLRLARKHDPVVRWHFIGGVAAAAAAVLIVATVLAPYWVGAPGDEQAGQGAPEVVPVAIFYVDNPGVLYGEAYVSAALLDEDRAFSGNITTSPFLPGNRHAPDGMLSGASFQEEEYRVLRARVKELEAEYSVFRARAKALEERLQVLEARREGDGTAR